MRLISPLGQCVGRSFVVIFRPGFQLMVSGHSPSIFPFCLTSSGAQHRRPTIFLPTPAVYYTRTTDQACPVTLGLSTSGTPSFLPGLGRPSVISPDRGRWDEGYLGPPPTPRTVKPSRRAAACTSLPPPQGAVRGLRKETRSGSLGHWIKIKQGCYSGFPTRWPNSRTCWPAEQLP